jgi:predicted ATP-binding protein involved in virulence
MRLLNLELKNIGPFIEGNINFISEEDNLQKPPVTIITGENGTGKTIVLDAIRGLLLANKKLERDILRNSNDFLVSLRYATDNNIALLSSSKIERNNQLQLNSYKFKNRFLTNTNQETDATWDWVVDYWTSKLSTDSFAVKNLVAPIPENVYVNSLNGIQKNVEVAQLICFFDYLKSSDNNAERELGIRLFEILKKIIKLSLIDGEFKYVARTTLEPIVSQTGQEISLEKLSSGNLYLIQRMVSLLGKMYSIHILNKHPIEDLCKAQGVLLIDEAENHLHPKWQKTFIQSIQEIFPNLQLIVTTHSPFIVSSVENAKIFVCNSKGDHAEITDETDVYSNKPVEEILLSPLFGVTQPFNQKITELLQKRKIAIKTKNDVQKTEIDEKLKEINPQYFNFLNIDSILSEITSK